MVSNITDRSTKMRTKNGPLDLGLREPGCLKQELFLGKSEDESPARVEFRRV